MYFSSNIPDLNKIFKTSQAEAEEVEGIENVDGIENIDNAEDNNNIDTNKKMSISEEYNYFINYQDEIKTEKISPDVQWLLLKNSDDHYVIQSLLQNPNLIPELQEIKDLFNDSNIQISIDLQNKLINLNNPVIWDLLSKNNHLDIQTQLALIEKDDVNHLSVLTNLIDSSNLNSELVQNKLLNRLYELYTKHMNDENLYYKNYLSNMLTDFARKPKLSENVQNNYFEFFKYVGLKYYNDNDIYLIPLSENPNLSIEIQSKLLKQDNREVLKNLAQNNSLSKENQWELFEKGGRDILYYLSKNPTADAKLKSLEGLIMTKIPIDPDLQFQLFEKGDKGTLDGLAENIGLIPELQSIKGLRYNHRDMPIDEKLQWTLVENGDYACIDNLLKNVGLIPELESLKGLNDEDIPIDEDVQKKLLLNKNFINIKSRDAFILLYTSPSLIENAYEYNDLMALYMPNAPKNLRKNVIFRESKNFADGYNANGLSILENIGSRTIYSMLIENINNVINQVGIISFHDLIGWLITLEPEYLEQKNINNFLVKIKDQSNSDKSKYITLRKNYFEEFGVWIDDLLELERFSALKLQKLINENDIPTNIEEDTLIDFLTNLQRYGNYREDQLLEFARKVRISEEQKITPYTSSLQDQTGNQLKFEITEKNNPINVVLFKVNGCCQQLGGVAEEAIYDGLSNPNSAFLAVEDPNRRKNSLVAMSWLRLGKDNTLYMDNIEATKNYNTKWVSDLFEEFAQEIQNKFGYKNVVVGMRYTKVPFDKETIQIDENNLTPNGYGDYTDLIEEGAVVVAFNLERYKKGSK